MILALIAERQFNLVAAILGILLLLVLSIPLGFLIAFGLRKWHDRHPIEEADNEKKPLGLD
jgi:ABC-type dipeptide/oligopeptide/nickel transport system permease component